MLFWSIFMRALNRLGSFLFSTAHFTFPRLIILIPFAAKIYVSNLRPEDEQSHMVLPQQCGQLYCCVFVWAIILFSLIQPRSPSHPPLQGGRGQRPSRGRGPLKTTNKSLRIYAFNPKSRGWKITLKFILRGDCPSSDYLLLSFYIQMRKLVFEEGS